MKLKSVKKIVLDLLVYHPEFRNNDDVLYLAVINRLNPALTNITLAEFLQIRKKNNIPSFESVRRSRALIQSENEKLKPCEVVQQHRYRAEKEYYNFCK